MVRFIAGSATPPNPQPPDGAKARVTVATVDQTVTGHSLDVSPPERLSSVTRANLEQIERVNSITTSNSNRNESQTDLGVGKLCIESNGALSDRHIPEACINPTPEACNEPVQIPLALGSDSEPFGLSQTEQESWLNRIAAVTSAEDCMNCLEALNSLPSAVTEQIWSSAEPLLAHFWSVASSETSLSGNEYQPSDLEHNKGNNSSIKNSDSGEAKSLASPTINDEIQHQTGQGHSHRQALGFKDGSNEGNSQHTSPQPNWGDRLLSPSANKPDRSTTASAKDLITGLWVRTRDGLYGHLGAKVSDGRWWVVSSASRTTDAQSRLYAAADIIPMPSA